MTLVKDLEKNCEDYGCSLMIMPFNGNSMLYSLTDKFVIVTQDWIDNLEVDDNVFHNLVKIGECCFYQYSDDINERHAGALSCAIDLAKEYKLKISAEKKNEVLSDYDFDESDFEFVDICDESTIIDLVNKYGLPLKLKMPRYYGDFYYVAETNNTKRRMIEGTQFHNGEVYRRKSYSYREICSLYDADEVEKIEVDESAEDK